MNFLEGQRAIYVFGITESPSAFLWLYLESVPNVGNQSLLIMAKVQKVESEISF